MIKSKPLYRQKMCTIIFSLISNNNFSHYEVLKFINRKFLNDEIYLYHILVNTIEYIIKEENDDHNVVDFYIQKCKKGFNSNCDVIKLKSLKIVIHFIDLFEMIALEFAENVFKLGKFFNWEILSLVLIYCSRFLLILNISKMDKNKIEVDNNINTKEIPEIEQSTEKEKTDKEKLENTKPEKIEKEKASKVKNEKEKELERLEKERIEKERVEKERAEKERIERLKAERNEAYNNLAPETKKELEDLEMIINKTGVYENKFLSIINDIFEINSPHMTIKIGKTQI